MHTWHSSACHAAIGMLYVQAYLNNDEERNMMSVVLVLNGSHLLTCHPKACPAVLTSQDWRMSCQLLQSRLASFSPRPQIGSDQCLPAVSSAFGIQLLQKLCWQADRTSCSVRECATVEWTCRLDRKSACAGSTLALRPAVATRCPITGGAGALTALLLVLGSDMLA